MNTNIEYRATKELFRIISEDNGKSGYKYPIAAVLFDKEKNVIISSAVNIKPSNEGLLDVAEKSPFHAEISVIKDMEMKNISSTGLSILITIPPCHPCYEAIEKTNQINEIIFISRRYQSFKWDSRNRVISEKNLKLIEYNKLNTETEGIKELLQENNKYIRSIENICKFSGK